MKKIKASGIVIPFIIISVNASAVEIYNKDASKLDLYGKAAGLHYFSQGQSGTDKSYARMGIKGSTLINDRLTGYGQWEYNMPLDGTESRNDGNSQNSTRLGFAGLSFGEIGSFDYGRNKGVLYNIESWTDVMPEFGGNTWSNTDNYLTGRASGVATYNSNDFFGLVHGLNLAAQYQGKNDRRDTTTSNGTGSGLSLTYTTRFGISIGGAVSKSNRTELQMKDGKGETADAWTTGVKYDANNIYLAAMYSQTHNMTPIKATEGFAKSTRNLELVAQYQFENGLRPSIGYLESQGSELTGKGANGQDQTLMKYIELGTSYQFNKNMSVYADYKLNLLKETAYTDANSIDTGNIVATGIVYQF